MSELNPSEAQRKAMAEYLAGEYLAPSDMFDRCLKAVDAMIAAANNISEGAPVGTIARRPDGAWIARKEQCGKWDYRPFTNQGEWPQPDDADSWPVIYDPREDAAPRLAEAASKPRVFEKRLDPTAQQEPEEPGPPSNAHIKFPKAPRTPRVVDRLGVDERGSRWRDRQLGEWKFDGQAWRYLELTWTSVPGGEWVEAEPSKRYGPYVEVLS